MSDIVLIIVISVIALALVIGLIVGLVKGFTETKTWATEYLFTVVLSVLIYARYFRYACVGRGGS